MYYLNKMLESNKENGVIINKYIRKTIQKQIRIHNKYIYRYDRVTQAIEWIEDNGVPSTAPGTSGARTGRSRRPAW